VNIGKQEVFFLRTDNGKTYVDYKGSRGDNWKNVDTLLLAEPNGINGYPIRLINELQITGSNRWPPRCELDALQKGYADEISLTKIGWKAPDRGVLGFCDIRY
jgi:hypothetical protein